MISMASRPLERLYWQLTSWRGVGITLAILVVLLPLIYVALDNPLYGFGAAFLLLFVFVAWRWPQVATMIIFAAAPFQQDVSGGGAAKFSITEVTLALTIGIYYLHCLVRRTKFLGIGPMTFPVLAYFCICGLSSWQNWLDKDALLSLFQMFLYLVAAVSVFAHFVPRPEDNRLALYGLVLVGLFLVFEQFTGSRLLHLQKNGIGSSLACAVLVNVELWISERNPRVKHFLLFTLLLMAGALVLALSRGSWLGTGCGLMVIFFLRRQFQLMTRFLCVLVPVIILCWSFLPKDQKEYATGFDKGRENIRLRYESMDIALSHFTHHPIIGDGVGWRKRYDATNTALMILAETGVLGLAAFLSLHIAFFYMANRARKIISIDDTLFSFLVIGGALVVCKFTHGMVDHYWSRGAVSIAWSGAGMALGAYYASQQRRTPLSIPLIAIQGGQQ